MKELLQGIDPKKAATFISYVERLKTEQAGGKYANPWAQVIKDEYYVREFNRVLQKGLLIDGEVAYFYFEDGLKVGYTYHAYINKVLIKWL